MTDTTLSMQGAAAPASVSLGASGVAAAVATPAVQADVQPNGFVQLGLAPQLVQAVADLGYTQPTVVQQRTIPLALEAGQDRFVDLMVS